MTELENYLPPTELLAQLAEESSELSQAALKLRRALDNTNPTPVSIAECEENLIEEAADVLLCLYVCGVDTDAFSHTGKRMLDIGKEKFDRWVKRLEALNAERNG